MYKVSFKKRYVGHKLLGLIVKDSYKCFLTQLEAEQYKNKAMSCVMCENGLDLAYVVFDATITDVGLMRDFEEFLSSNNG